MKKFVLPLLCLLLTACSSDGEKSTKRPGAVALTADAVSHYCQMNVLEHPGPKAQIHIADAPAPLFFAQVRDAIAFLKSEERPGEVVAVYVSDMGKAKSWEHPGIHNWILAQNAMFVVGAHQAGGMGAPEVVPFGSLEKANLYAARKGGRVMTLKEIPSEAVLGGINLFQENEQ
ncbi:nitrous oxide reductase accessory protein NosL [Polycladidibacter stylochi]|uniref:nitrous oxide reductase accessory protein NosL n=1 Tax=Polycladidibacter stylochi TaxID=1807766 RepID=UPI00082B1ECF|nr:nitrous oxide reductase accessory protein NosL [Pseudovibrio stylochi]